jgi:integrase
MAIYKRGKVYWFDFVYRGVRHQKSTKLRNAQDAANVERDYRIKLVKGELDLNDRPITPKLKDFAETFLAHVRANGNAAGTLDYYQTKLDNLLAFPGMAGARLDAIDENLIARFIAWRSKDVKVATVNRALATLRRVLRYARDEKKLLRTVPRIRLLKGEQPREFVLHREAQPGYLDACPEPLKSVAELGLETGLRLGELLALRWSDVFEPVGGSGRGFIKIRKGKSVKARRNVPLTAVAHAVLERQRELSQSEFVFVGEDGRAPVSRSTVEHQHVRVRRLLTMPDDFVPHSWRHTCLTRLGEAGVDAFTIAKIAGHSSIMISEKYVHPLPEQIERAFDKAEASRAAAEAKAAEKRAAVPTVSTTVENPEEAAVQ